MKKTLPAALAAILLASSCEDPVKPADPVNPQPATEESLHGLLILNNGNWGSNDSDISLYCPDTKAVTPYVFQEANDMKLGDTGQDFLRLGDEIYIAMNGSRLVFVTDLMLRVKKTVVASGRDGSLSPRSLVAASGKVYVTYYEGFLGEIDPSKDYAVRTVEVGPSPEGVEYCNGKLYTADSGGARYPDYGHTVSVVDAETFSLEGSIEVSLNPQKIIADRKGEILYVMSLGDYGATAAKIQAVSLSDRSVTDLDIANPCGMAALDGGKFLAVSGNYGENWTIEGEVCAFDMESRSSCGRFLESAIAGFHSISCSGGYTAVSSSDYVTNGDVWLLDGQGKVVDRFDSGGLNPLKCLYLE